MIYPFMERTLISFILLILASCSTGLGPRHCKIKTIVVALPTFTYTTLRSPRPLLINRMLLDGTGYARYCGMNGRLRVLNFW